MVFKAQDWNIPLKVRRYLRTYHQQEGHVFNHRLSIIYILYRIAHVLHAEMYSAYGNFHLRTFTYSVTHGDVVEGFALTCTYYVTHEM